MANPSVAIIGAGVAGLACARVLASSDVALQVFDKGRGPGGRCSTRRSPVGRFDHGAPFFTAEDPRFLRQASRWVAAGAAAVWEPQVVGEGFFQGSVFVGTPSMNAILKRDAQTHGVEFGLRAGFIPEPVNGVVELRSETGEPLGQADIVILATPAPQTAELLPPSSPLKKMAEDVVMVPRWTLMLGLPELLQNSFDLWMPGEGAIEKIIREPAKPHHEPGERFVVHASHGWSAEHLEDDAEKVEAALLHQFAELVGPHPAPEHVAVHRWRYAEVAKPAGQPFGWDEEHRLATCGDWHLGSTVEAAYLSGYELGHKLKSLISAD